jgi:hypothetical protein
MFKKAGLGLIALALVFVEGCAHIPGGIAPSTTPIEGRSYDVLGDAVATDSRVSLFCGLPISGANSIQGAVDKAKRQFGADALIDVTVEAYSQFWLLFCNNTTMVHGKAIRFKK